MKYVFSLIFASLSFFFAQSVLADDKTDACTVVLCLASGSMPSECETPVKNYLERFAEEPWNAGDYLNLCEMGSAPDVPNAKLIGQAYGHCDAASLNKATMYVAGYSGRNAVIYHHSAKPAYCDEYSAMVKSNGGADTPQGHFVIAPPYQSCTTTSGKRICNVKTPPVDAGHWEN